MPAGNTESALDPPDAETELRAGTMFFTLAPLGV